MRRVLFSLVLLLLVGALALFFLTELEDGAPDSLPSRPESSGTVPDSLLSEGDGAPARENQVAALRETVRADPEPDPEPVSIRQLDVIVSVLRRVDLRPVGGAECRLTRGYLGEVVRSGSTGPDGRFTTSIHSGESGDDALFVVTRKDGFVQQVLRLDPLEREDSVPTELRVILDPGLPLRGQVLDGTTLQPLAEAEIEAFLEVDFSELAEGIFTDREGRFALPGVPVSKPVSLTASLPGYREGGLSQSFEAARSDLQLLLFRGGSVEGIVHAPDGRPAAAARVTVRVLLAAEDVEEHQALTDEQGFFRIDELAFPGRCELRAASDRFGSGRAEPFDLVRDQQLVQRDIQLQRSGTELAVMVLDSTGSAVSELSLRLLDQNGMPPRSADTGEIDWNRGFAFQAGWHVYSPIIAGVYQVIAERAGQPTRSVRVEVQEGRRNEATILLKGGVALAGRVRNQGGVPQPSITLEFIYPLGEQADGLTDEQIERVLEGDDLGLVRVGGLTNDQGRFHLEGLPQSNGAVLVGDPLGGDEGPASRYALLIEHPVMPGGAALDLVLQDAPRVIGRFEPPDHLGEVSCLIRSGPMTSGRTLQVDPEGRFELRFARLGIAFDLVIEHAAGAPFFVFDLELAAGETRDLGRLKILPGGSLEGQVTDREGRPIPAAEVSATAGDWVWWKETVADRQGRFRLDGLPAVAGNFMVSSEQHVDELFELESLGGAHRQNVVLFRPGRLEGRLLDRTGKPRAEASIEAIFQGPDLQTAKWSDDALTDRRGRFTLLLHPGRYLVYPEGRADNATEVQIEEDGALEIQLGG